MNQEELEILRKLIVEMPEPAPTRKWLALVLGKGHRTISDLERIFRENYPPYERIWLHQKTNKRGALCPYFCYCLWRATRFYPDPIRPNQISRTKLELALQKEDANFSYEAFKRFRELVLSKKPSREEAEANEEDGHLRIFSY